MPLFSYKNLKNPTNYQTILTLLRLCVNVRTVPLCTQGALLPTYRGLLKRVWSFRLNCCDQSHTGGNCRTLSLPRDILLLRAKSWKKEGTNKRRETGAVKNNNTNITLKTASCNIISPGCVLPFVVGSWKGTCWTLGPTCCRSEPWGTSLWTRRLLGTAPITAIHSSGTAKTEETARQKKGYIFSTLHIWHI